MEKEQRIKELEKALHITFMMLINVCPSDLAGDKKLLDVFDVAEKALGFKANEINH